MKHAWNVFSVLIVLALAVAFISMGTGTQTYAQGILPTPDLGIDPGYPVPTEDPGYPAPVDPGYPVPTEDYGYPVDYFEPIDPDSSAIVYQVSAEEPEPEAVEVVQTVEPVVIVPVTSRLMSKLYLFVR